MISLLVMILVFALIFGLAVWVIRMLPIPQPFANIALAVMALLFLLVLLNSLGLVGAPIVVRLR